MVLAAAERGAAAVRAQRSAGAENGVQYETTPPISVYARWREYFDDGRLRAARHRGAGARAHYCRHPLSRVCAMRKTHARFKSLNGSRF